MTATERVLTLRDEPIILDTAHGPIEIHRIMEPRRAGRLARKIRVKLPPGVFARIGMVQLAERSPWVELIDGEGITPRHDMLRAVTTASGDVELTPVKALRVVGLRPPAQATVT